MIASYSIPLYNVNNNLIHNQMTFEEAKFMSKLYAINPALTCSCDSMHMCQQCFEDGRNHCDLSAFESSGYEGI